MALAYPAPIKDGALDLTPAPPEFQKSFSDTVANSGTAQDGFDLLLRPADAHLADSNNFLAGLDIGLHDLGVSQNELGTDFHADFANHLAATIKSGQPDFDAYAVHLTGNNPPASTAPGPPVQGGGGLQPVMFGALPAGGAGKTISVEFVNAFDHPVHPTGVKIEQGKLQVFVAVSECGATIPALGTCNIAVTFRPLLAGHYVGLLVFMTDDTNSPYTLGLSGTVTPGSAPPPPPPPSGAPPPPPPSGGGGGSLGGTGCDPFNDPLCLGGGGGGGGGGLGARRVR